MCRSLTEISGSLKITGSQVTKRPGSPEELLDTSKSIKISQMDLQEFWITEKVSGSPKASCSSSLQNFQKVSGSPKK